MLLLAAAAGLWWWLSQQDKALEDQGQANLEAILEKRRALAVDLAAAKAATAADCPPGQTRQPLAGDAMPPPASPVPAVPARPALPTSGEVKPLGDAALAERLEQATAMVLVPSPDGKGLGTGTGFFIAPNLLVTNRHVVEKASQQVLLVSNALRSIRHASVLRITTSSSVGSPDFALLRMDDGVAPGVLDMTPEIGKLAGVVAAGFPSVVVANDPRFRRLLAGDYSQAPDLSLTQGAVQSLLTGADGMPLIVHTASIAKGNSGGPLVDACGRLVGVNTFITIDQSQSSKINYAIRAQVMQAFLESSGNAARADARACAHG
ncbi:serine protease [Variovorax rhizosphaerae]|uniref:Serine protease n=1 Tax=Variovorax rhizosphaerae TaxID=1836200 RepID=A0ABU8WR13_9BURK